VRRFFIPVVVALLAATLTGCAGNPPRPAKPPLVDPETRFTPPAKHEPQRILAPPPAYGNKIVMAEARKPARL